MKSTHRESSRIKVKVLHIIDHLGLGGAQNFLVDLVSHLDQSDYVPEVCVLRRNAGDTYLLERLSCAGIKTIYLRGGRWHLLKVYQMIDLIKTENPAIVHTHLTAASFIGRFSAILNKTPIIIQHDHSANEYKRSHPLLYYFSLPIDRLFNPFTSMTITCSHWVEQFVHQVRKIQDEKITVIHNYVDLDRFDPTAYAMAESREALGLNLECSVIGTVSRLSEFKGIEYLLQAVSILLCDRMDVNLVIVGDGPKRNDLMKYAIELDIDKRVIFTGYRQDIPSLIKAFDVFVLPSLFETFGMSILEAMAMKKNIIATDVGGISELVIDGWNGLLVAPKDALSMAQSVRQLIDSRELAQKLSINARKTAEGEFSLINMVSSVERVYQDLLKEKLA